MNKISNIEKSIGKITSNGEVILDDVLLRIEHTIDDASGLKDWYGTFSPEGFIDTDSYRLILQDGREGDIIVTNVNSSNRGIYAQFEGSGPLE